MHLGLIGLIGYPLGWAAMFRPLQQWVMPTPHWFASASLYGVGLCVVAIGAIAGFATGDTSLALTRSPESRWPGMCFMPSRWWRCCAGWTRGAQALCVRCES